MCTPESDNTGSLSSPTFNAKAAFSKAGCIFPGPNSPRSPPFLLLLQWLSLAASSRNRSASSPPPTRQSCSRNSLTMATASSRVRVHPSGSFQDDGLRESRCFTSRWDARTARTVRLGSASAAPPAGRFSPDDSHSTTKVSGRLPKVILAPSFSCTGLFGAIPFPSTLVPCVDWRSMRKRRPSWWWTSAAWEREHVESFSSKSQEPPSLPNV
mmetsp:Transcript_30539/g.72713  ORF Transcript_30539/g.72713 Transcript_30539/m.72713 type:complete len:212 (-) Transcript_30539:472-1107(-)